MTGRKHHKGNESRTKWVTFHGKSGHLRRPNLNRVFKYASIMFKEKDDAPTFRTRSAISSNMLPPYPQLMNSHSRHRDVLPPPESPRRL